MLSLGFPTLPNTLRSALEPNFFASISSSGLQFPLRANIISNLHQPLLSLSKLRNCHASASHGGGEERERVMMKEELPAGLRADLMPKHVAVIMDGNRRWAAARGLPPISGYSAGRQTLKELVRLCCKWKVEVLSAFALSTENWSRPKEEIDPFVELFEDLMKSDFDEPSKRYGCRVTVIGQRSMMPKSLQDVITQIEETTATNSGTHVTVGFSYSGKCDIIQACKSVANNVKDGFLHLEDISENLIEQELELKCVEFPCPDLLIRTSGESRLSNYMLWQLADSELIFAKQLFPDFGEAEFIEALKVFQNRRR